ncbi:unannotated protein [freshwater metagenome]|uniref:Unannotated protein n=1 Tax=freshwater metagenome TaxID=449393 RepID=A0A6J7F652_9ZZZZ
MSIRGAVASTRKVRRTTSPTLPAASVGRTSRAWSPSASAAGVNGEVHVAQSVVVAPVMRHSNVAASSASSASKRNAGERSFVRPVGPSVIVAFGGVRSSVEAVNRS